MNNTIILDLAVLVALVEDFPHSRCVERRGMEAVGVSNSWLPW